MKSSYGYSLKVWLTSVIVVPFIQMIEGLIIGNHTSISNAEQMLILTLVFGLLLSVPSWLLLWMSVSVLSKLTARVSVLKLCFSVISIILAVLPFILLADTIYPSTHDLIWLGPYPVMIVVCIWFYKLNPSRTLVEVSV